MNRKFQISLVRLHFQDVSEDEAIAIVHSRLLSLQPRRIEARGFRYGVSVGVVASATILAISIGALTLYSGAGPTGAPPVTDERVSRTSKAASVSDLVPKQRLFRIGHEGSQKRAPRENRIESRSHSQCGRPALRFGCSLVT